MPQILESELQDLSRQAHELAVQYPIEVEHCWVLIGTRLGKVWFGRQMFMSSGAMTEVNFDAEGVFDWDDQFNNVLGFMHTHPQTSAYPSATDHATMKAWVSSLGKPLVCAIQGTDGLKSYWYEDDESIPTDSPFLKLGNRVMGIW